MSLLAHLQSLVALAERRIVGLMSGTSLDGIDAALVRVRGAGLSTAITLERFECTPWAGPLRHRLLAAASGEPMPAAEHARLHFEIGAAFADATRTLLSAACVAARDVHLVGAHGQTLFHHAPRGAGAWTPDRTTWQAGSLPMIATRTGLVVVGDFRSADVALGGTGAPLVPYVDYLLRRSRTENRVLLNLGGIANLTYLRAGGAPSDVLAWDVGPANMISDSLARLVLGQECDAGGAVAARGRPDQHLVDTLLQGEYFQLPAPKSTGREQFGAAYVDDFRRAAAARGLGTEDLFATAVWLSARGVQHALTHPPLAGAPIDAVYVTGGGRQNRALVAALETCLAPARVHGFEALGLDPNAKEAVDFAILANEALHGHAGNLPSVTGATRPAILGTIAASGLAPAPLER